MTEPIKSKLDVPARKPMFYITQGYRHEIIINDHYELHKPHFKSINDLVFGFLYKNSNKTFTKKEIEDSIGRSMGKSFNTILNELGFKGELRRLFFPNVSKIAIEFKNNHHFDNLISARTDQNKLENQILQLKRWEDKL